MQCAGEVLWSQQPLMHEAPSQPHTPLTQESVPRQVSQTTPSAPHALLKYPGRQMLPEQQPVHEVLSQTHVLLRQRWPVVQAAPVPHPQVPSARQALVRAPAQLLHAPPFIPQVVVVGVVQVAPRQQPEGQLVPSQMQVFATQRWPGPHAGLPPQRQLPVSQLSALLVSQAPHAAPLVPHWLPEVWVTHVVPAQQPEPQVVLSQP